MRPQRQRTPIHSLRPTLEFLCADLEADPPYQNCMNASRRAYEEPPLNKERLEWLTGTRLEPAELASLHRLEAVERQVKQAKVSLLFQVIERTLPRPEQS